FPAAHADALAAWQWMLDNAGNLGGDPGRAAIVGEDAGGNLAVEIAVRAKAGPGPRPVHLVLVSPMASADLARPSHAENLDSRPLSTRGLRWLQAQFVKQPSDLGDPRLELVGRGDLGGLPPTTIVLAAIDPLRSEGEALADTLRRSGVWVDATVYDGVTAQFFGLARVQQGDVCPGAGDPEPQGEFRGGGMSSVNGAWGWRSG
ncbi:MAG TPA: alpha/beta hydrolase, partial [Alphaproteobacteria bacterium]|nr:alpha/beta hydrolase [Alphaproteobacteria bacterium]